MSIMETLAALAVAIIATLAIVAMTIGIVEMILAAEERMQRKY